MVAVFEWTPESRADWDAWVKSRPEVIQNLAQQYPPNKLYRIKETGQRVTLISYGEDRTARVNVTGKYNTVMFDREVFGVPFDDLEECDLPDKDELIGTVLTNDADIEGYIDELRPIVLAARGIP